MLASKPSYCKKVTTFISQYLRNICDSFFQNEGSQLNKPKFVPVTTLEDVQAIRCAEFHPRGFLYAVGSNSKSLRICAYPDTKRLSKDSNPVQPNVLFKRNKHHRVRA